MLAVLDYAQQDIFLKTVAASLDLTTVRQHKGRLVRGLLLKGHGSNGKDTLRECVAAMYGYRGMTSATLTDFAAYDQGRKFPLARLSNSRVNWASENANTTKLDKIQSLKAFITGDPISIEGKGKDEYDFNPVGVALFNVNDTPNIQASMDAIKTRYGVLTFNKTFKIGADLSKGELEADPRFKYDPDFLRSEVLPAFLNRVLDALTRLMADGIDYSCTQRALESIQAENSHLFQFCQDVGLGATVSQLVSQKPLPDKDGEPVTPVLLLDEKNEIKPQDFEQCDRGSNQLEDRGSELTKLAHPLDTARDTASPIALPTASLLPHRVEADAQAPDPVLRQIQSAPAPAEALPNADAIAPNEIAMPPEPIKVGNTMIVDCPGSKHHGKRGTVVRLRTERFQGQELHLADLNIPGEQRCVEAQMSWLRRAEVRNE